MIDGVRRRVFKTQRSERLGSGRIKKDKRKRESSFASGKVANVRIQVGREEGREMRAVRAWLLSYLETWSLSLASAVEVQDSRTTTPGVSCARPPCPSRSRSPAPPVFLPAQVDAVTEAGLAARGALLTGRCCLWDFVGHAICWSPVRCYCSARDAVSTRLRQRHLELSADFHYQ